MIISERYFKQASQQQQRQQTWSDGVGASDKRRRVDRAGAGDDVINVGRSLGATTEHTEPKQPEDMDALAAGDDTVIPVTDGQNGGEQ